MIIPESDAVTRIKTSIGQALAMVENSTCVCVLFGGSLWTRRITRGARTIPINGRSLEKKKLLRNWDKKANSQKELWSGQINDINNQFYGSIAINDGWWSVISRYFVLCFSLFRKFASVKRKTLFYLNEVAEESYPYRGNVRSKVSVWMFFSAFRTDFRSLPNKTSVSLWQQPATAAFKIPGNIPSTVKPGTPLFFVW